MSMILNRPRKAQPLGHLRKRPYRYMTVYKTVLYVPLRSERPTILPHPTHCFNSAGPTRHWRLSEPSSDGGSLTACRKIGGAIGVSQWPRRGVQWGPITAEPLNACRSGRRLVGPWQ